MLRSHHTFSDSLAALTLAGALAAGCAGRKDGGHYGRIDPGRTGHDARTGRMDTLADTAGNSTYGSPGVGESMDTTLGGTGRGGSLDTGMTMDTSMGGTGRGGSLDPGMSDTGGIYMPNPTGTSPRDTGRGGSRDPRDSDTIDTTGIFGIPGDDEGRGMGGSGRDTMWLDTMAPRDSMERPNPSSPRLPPDLF